VNSEGPVDNEGPEDSEGPVDSDDSADGDDPAAEADGDPAAEAALAGFERDGRNQWKPESDSSSVSAWWRGRDSRSSVLPLAVPDAATRTVSGSGA